MNAEMHMVESIRGKAVWGSARFAPPWRVAGVLRVAAAVVVQRRDPHRAVAVVSDDDAASRRHRAEPRRRRDPAVRRRHATAGGDRRGQRHGDAPGSRMKDPRGPAAHRRNAITLTQYHVESRPHRRPQHPGRRRAVRLRRRRDRRRSPAAARSAFTLVRIQAKQEAPLKALAHGGGATRSPRSRR